MGTFRKVGDYELIAGDGAARGLHCVLKHTGEDKSDCPVLLSTFWSNDDEDFERLENMNDESFVAKCEEMEFS